MIIRSFNKEKSACCTLVSMNILKKSMTMQKIKQNSRERGSALVLTVIVLVNALLIVAAISSISVIERKMSSRAKNSSPAFQAADSGVEWVLYKIANEGDPLTTDLAAVFDPDTSGMGANGHYVCPDGTSSAVDLVVDCEFYFINVLGEVIVDDSTRLIDIDSVRAVGRAGVQEERVSRAIEVMMEIAHCPPNFIPVGDFCIQHDDNPALSWVEAATDCAESHEGRLCSSAEWFAACLLSMPGEVLETDVIDMRVADDEWVDDMTSVTDARIVGQGGCSNVGEDDIAGGNHEYRCCVNIQQ